jgi:hypothetical protein
MFEQVTDFGIVQDCKEGQTPRSKIPPHSGTKMIEFPTLNAISNAGLCGSHGRRPERAYSEETGASHDQSEGRTKCRTGEIKGLQIGRT